VHLRWAFESDGGWSDADCFWATAGAAQIDLIEIFFDQGTGPVQIGGTETCEPGDPVQWQITISPAVGQFAQVWPLLDDLDPDRQNDTPQFAFIDDGVVVPGTGGTPCTTWCYGPGGWCVNCEGGLLGPSFELENEIWSPPIAWPEGEFDQVIFRFGVYSHETLGCTSPGICYVWHVRSTSDPTGESGWSAWQDDDFLYYGGPQYIRGQRIITDLMVPGCTFVQLALGAHQLPMWHWCELDPTPAPYFDNVSLCAVSGLTDVPPHDTVLRLDGPVPNPFNPAAGLGFTLPAPGPVRLAVFDLRGRLVCTLLDEPRPAGPHTIVWDGRNDRGEPAAAGTYLFRLETAGEVISRKGSLVK